MDIPATQLLYCTLPTFRSRSSIPEKRKRDPSPQSLPLRECDESVRLLDMNVTIDHRSGQNKAGGGPRRVARRTRFLDLQLTKSIG